MPKSKPKRPVNRTTQNILIFSGLTVEMLTVIGIGSYTGMQLDKYLQTSKPYFTALFSLIFVGLSFYSLYIQIQSWERKKSS